MAISTNKKSNKVSNKKTVSKNKAKTGGNFSYSSAPLGSAQRTRDLIASTKSMLAQTKAQGSKAYKGSSYEKEFLKNRDLQQPSDIADQGLPKTSDLDTGQPSPTTVNATPFSNPQVPSQVQTQAQPEATYQQAVQNLNQSFGKEGMGGDVYRGAVESLKRKYQTGVQNANASGLPMPMDNGEARMASSAFIPQQGDLVPSPTDTMFSMDGTGDPYMSSLIQTFQNYFSPENQKMSLAQEYDKMYKKAGLEKLDTEIMNTKNIIEGSEDDIRTEITKAGGFATDSQVMALTNARNKSLIKNYDNLVSMRDSAEQRLNTMVNLTIQDRQMADQKFNSMMNFGMQIMDYKNKMQQNAVSQFQWLASQPGGFEAIQAQASNPYYKGLIDKVFGGTDGLAILAERNKPKVVTTKRNTSWQDINGQRVLVDDDTGEIINNPSRGMTGNDTPDTLQENINRVDTLLADTTSIKNLTGQLQSPKLSGFLKGALKGLMGGPLAPITSAVMGTKGAVKEANQANDFLSGASYIINNTTFDRLLQLKKGGATFGNLTDSERQAVGAAANEFNAMAIRDQQGNVIGFRGTDKKLREALKWIRRGYEASQNMQYASSLPSSDLLEIQSFY